MKIIELLNKIANGEEVPKKIKYRNKIFIYDKDNQCYIFEDYNIYNDLLMELSNHKGTELHYEVEIIEEPQEHKMPEKLDLGDYTEITSKNDMEYKMFEYIFNKNANAFYNKINEIIDYLEEIK